MTWEPLSVGLLLLATVQGVALALLLSERRRTRRALDEIQLDLKATLDAAERAADAAEGAERPVSAVSGSRAPIGFRASDTHGARSTA